MRCMIVDKRRPDCIINHEPSLIILAKSCGLHLAAMEVPDTCQFTPNRMTERDV